MSAYIQIMTTTETHKQAEVIAGHLVETGLAACCQIIGPLTSVYRWQGKVEEAHEYLCLIKTAADLYAAVEDAIRDLHPYEVPEILAVPVVQGSAAYLGWMQESLRDAP